MQPPLDYLLDFSRTHFGKRDIEGRTLAKLRMRGHHENAPPLGDPPNALAAIA